MSFPRGCTPTIRLTVQSVDLSLAKNVYATFTLGLGEKIRKEGDAIQVEPHRVSLRLTQEESLKIISDTTKVQLNWTYPGGMRMGTKIGHISIDEQLEMEVLE